MAPNSSLRIAAFLILCAARAAAGAQDSPPSAPAQHAPAMTKQDSFEALNNRGDHAMGFDHAKTTHHFFLTRHGGIIEVAANDPKDAATLDSVRSHLGHIAHSFAEGDFDLPMFIHDRTPPGVPVMKRFKRDIRYALETTPAGARIVITTRRSEALSAVHQFLRFQIQDHKTGDALEVK